MTHSEVVASGVMEEYLMGWLDLQAAAEFERHMFGCASCASEAAAGLAFALNLPGAVG